MHAFAFMHVCVPECCLMHDDDVDHNVVLVVCFFSSFKPFCSTICKFVYLSFVFFSLYFVLFLATLDFGNFFFQTTESLRFFFFYYFLFVFIFFGNSLIHTHTHTTTCCIMSLSLLLIRLICCCTIMLVAYIHTQALSKLVFVALK